MKKTKGFQKNNQINKGRIPWNKGVTHSLETRRKISETRKMKGTSLLQLEHLRKINEENLGKKHSEESIQKMRTAQKGHAVSDETRKKISNSLKGKVTWNIGRKAKPETIERMRMASTGKLSSRKGKKYPEISGKNHWNWKGGINPPNDSFRKSMDFKIWSKAVKERDNFTCRECGIIGGKLHSHHIKPFSLFPELRLAIDNGITLCVSCHRKTDSYAGRVLTYTQRNQALN